MPQDSRITIGRLPGDIAVIVLPDLSAACINADLPPHERQCIAAFLAAHLPPATDGPTSGAGHPGA
jgi:uncharacterized protein YejL (UPF0352 family)